MRFATKSKRSAWLSLALIVAGAAGAHAQLPSAGVNVSVQELKFAYQTNSPIPLPQTIQIASDTDRAYTVTTSITTPAGALNWLTVNGQPSATGTSTATGSFFTIGVLPSTLQPGTYTGNVRVQPAGGVAAKDIPVTLKVSGSPQVALTVPLVSIQGQAGTQVLLLVPVSSTGASVPYTATVGQYQGASQWLSVTASGQTGAAGSAATSAILTANLASVPAGTHYAVLNFRSAGADAGDVTLPVVLNVTAATTVAANPAGLNFAFQAGNLGGTTGNKVINVTSSPNANMQYTASVTGSSLISIAKTSTGPGAPTLTGSTPETLYVIVNPVGIPAGTSVSGEVTIVSANNTIKVPVNATVTTAPLLVPSAESVNFNHSLGGSVPPVQTIALTSTGQQLPFTITEAEVTGGDWLTVSSNSSSTTPANISFSVNQTRLLQLAAGTYTANVTVTSSVLAGNSPLNIPVTLTVSGTAGLLNVSTAAGNNTLTFNAELNGVVPNTQTVTVASTDGTDQPFTISVDPASASWVLLNTRSGQTGTAGTFFTVGVSPSGVPGAGKHEADIIVTPGASPGTTPVPQKVHVVFNVNATATVTANPSKVEVTQGAVNGPPPSPVTIELTSAVSGTAFNVSAQPPATWLNVELSGTTLTPKATLRLTFNTAGLAAGRYETELKISPANAREVSIPVTLTIAGAQLNLSQTTFNVSHTQGSTAPANLTLNLSSTGAAAAFTAVATSTGNWLSVDPPSGTTAASTVSGTPGAPTPLTLRINPTGLTPGTYNGTVAIASPTASNSPQTVTVRLTVTAQSNPVITSIQNAARNEQTLIAPGLFVAIKGTNLGPSTAVNGTIANGSYGTTVGETRVLFDGIVAPITYASATQVNVVAPYSLFGRTTTRVQVEYRGVRSDAIEYRVVDTAPGLFTSDSTGRGQGAILNQNLTVNTVSNPARRGEVIVLYATGEGRLRPSPVDGAITTGTVENLPRPVVPVTVKINGQDVPAADIFYAGSAPGIIAGVMQVNLRISPSLNITAPSQVPVEISVGGQPSQSGVTVAVIP